MNYFDYINSLEPSTELKEKTRQRVQNEMAHKNIRLRNKKMACLTTAACFAIFVTAVSVSKTMTNTPNIIQNNTVESTEATQVQTTQVPVTDSNDVIQINTANDGNKYGAQKIKIGDKVFVQYCSSGNKANWGEDNGNIVIKKSDIGDLICTVASNNLIDFEHWDDYSAMTSTQAKENKFNNAKAYEYKRCKNGTQFLVQTDSDYYLFYLSDLTSKVSASEVFDIYSASGNNEVSKIEVFKCDASQDYVPYALCEIKDKKRIMSVINTLKSTENNYTLSEIKSKGYIEDEFFDFVFVFADGTELKAQINKNNSFGFCVVQKDDYGHHILSNSQYEALMEAITNIDKEF